MARKKKGRSRTTTSNRMDYRTGGRVGYPHGGPHFGGEPGGTIDEEREKADEAISDETTSAAPGAGTGSGSGGTSSQPEPTELEKAQQAAREGAQAIIDDAGKNDFPVGNVCIANML